MNSRLLTILLLIFFIIGSNLFPEKLNIKNVNFHPENESAWKISHNFETASDYSEAIAIPFNYPFEATFLPGTKPESQPVFSAPTYRLNLFGNVVGNRSTVLINSKETAGIVAYKTNIIVDNNHYARDTNPRMPNLWQVNSPVANTSSGIVFAYLKKNMGLNLDLSFRMAGNLAGQALMESLISHLTFSYNISNKLIELNPDYRLNMILRVSNIQYFDDRVVPKKLDFSKTNFKSQFISSGFTLNAKSMVFEGLIRVPIQQQPIFDLDGLLRPELQGRLGLKWHLPEYIQP